MAKSTITSAAALLAAAALRTKVVPFGDASVIIRELSVTARDEFLAAHADGSKAGVACLLRHAIVGEDGCPLLSEDLAQELMDKSGSLVQGLVKEVIELSGLGEQQASD